MLQLLVSLIVVILCSLNSAVGQCNSQQQCVKFDTCPEYDQYKNVPNRNWPTAIRTQVQSRVCGREVLNGRNVYSVCCTKSQNRMELLDFEECGRLAGDRISFGEKAKVFQFPWMALIKNSDGEFICGGSLITKNFVLSAAHCFRGLLTSVRLGENDISKPIDCNPGDDCAPPVQDIAIDKVIKHKQYSSSKKKNDIGLIKLAKAAVLGDSVKTICLPISSKIKIDNFSTDMYISGWGVTEHNVSSNVLLWAKVPVPTNVQCTAAYKKSGYTVSLDDSHVCAGGKNRMETCYGDSGGPLQYFNKESRTIQHGVVSYGLDTCGIDNLPGIFTKVSFYIQWILDNMQ